MAKLYSSKEVCGTWFSDKSKWSILTGKTFTLYESVKVFLPPSWEHTLRNSGSSIANGWPRRVHMHDLDYMRSMPTCGRCTRINLTPGSHTFPKKVTPKPAGKFACART